MRGLTASLVFISLLLLVHADPCPNGYTQFSDGGDCFKAILGVGLSINNMESMCGEGGLLASIHSEEENQFVRKMRCSNPQFPETQNVKIIGLRCTTEDCKWDDGTALDYEKLENPDYPGTGCFVLDNLDGTWFSSETECNAQRACWVCRVKAETFDCAEGEIEYKGGCVSVHSESVNQKTAEDSCPNGGHLVSIHSAEENTFYQTLASNAGLTGYFYIGGNVTGNDIAWIDQTVDNYNFFARYFPNPIFGECLQVELSTEFGTLGQWTNIDCTTRQPYICFRDGRILQTTTTRKPTTTTEHPLADSKCPPVQYFTKLGKVYSPNYPFSIPSNQRCEYIIGTDLHTKASFKFPSYNCDSGAMLTVYDGLDSDEPLLHFSDNAPKPSRVYSASSNVVKIIFETTNTVSGTGWEVEFFGLK